MSQSSNNIDNFEFRQRNGANQEEASISEEMPLLQATSPINPGSATQGDGVANPMLAPWVPARLSGLKPETKV
ncbi:hypothetical protein LIER_30727 [Lithospermum erythrorhizon]|uniref:Uncharacterized protein n=1 Tax=Lithospermum erythrorhizon TaxID=34254 RepID=A0AAV3RNN6_LITER